MPLNTQVMLATARARFSSFQLRLPTASATTSPRLGISPGGMTGGSSPQAPRGTPMPCPPALFVAASNDARDVELQRVTNASMDSYLSHVCDAIVQAHSIWLQQARLVNVIVNGITASAGTLQGPALGPAIRQNAPREGAWQRSRSEAIAVGIGFCWETWQRAVTVPGLPWYPSFVAVPAPIAPPTPNVPTPLIVVCQNSFLMNASMVKSQMQAHYSGDNEWPNQLFEAVAFGFERAFQVWVSAQVVRNVMGSGPVPTFAPPYVPVGPVVGGTGNQVIGAWAF